MKAREPEYEVDISAGDNSRDVLDKLERTVKRLTQDDPTVRQFYIGIASGPDPKFAMQRRYDDKKRAWGITHMIAIYRSRDQPLCRYVEGCLEQFFQHVNQVMVTMDGEPPDILNGCAGGGGRNSSQPWHYVYVAVERAGKKA